MLHHFRKYQKFLYIVITVIIVISFSFFGTYSTLGQTDPRGETSFIASDGTAVSKGELEEMVSFLKTDAHDKWIFGGMWGPNFLNDGVLQKDLMETGLAELLIEAYSQELQDDLTQRLEKEKRFSPYSHPEADFLSAAAAWNMFSPDLVSHLNALKLSDDALSKKAIQERIALFTAERKFPAPFLAQVLRYQQKQYNWLPRDPQLENGDLSLFGYHTVEDWFGPTFLQLSAQFIINSAAKAKANGLYVSKEEALADLQRMAAKSYAENSKNPRFAISSATDYYKEQLRILGIDQTKAVKIWQQVLLFRRLFDQAGNTALLDPLPFQKFHSFAKESAEVTLYQLPEALKLKDFLALQQFETYLDLVAANRDKKDPLALPTAFLTPEQVKKNADDLVQKRYLVKLAHVDKGKLHAKVSIKDTWNWEGEAKNFEQMAKLFPHLSEKKATTYDERLSLLDRLSDTERRSIDKYAREQIIHAHPEWIEEELKQATQSTVTLNLSEKKGGEPLYGLNNRKELMEKLDKLPIGSELTSFSQDKNNYYALTLLDRSNGWEVLGFEEAKNLGVLTALVDKKVSAQVTKKNLSKEEAAKETFQSTLKAIQKYKGAPVGLIPDRAAAYRFAFYLEQTKEAIQKNPQAKEIYVRQEKVEEEGPKLPSKEALTSQWKLIESPHTAIRGGKTPLFDVDLATSLKDNEWSNVIALKTGGLAFFQRGNQGDTQFATEVQEATFQARAELAKLAQRKLMQEMLETIQKNG